VPDVVGQSEADATKAIGDAGLKPEVFRAYDDTVAKGVVTRQSPSASAEVVPGTTVGLLVSEGPAPSQPSAPEQESVQVPAVVGQNEADASRTLTDAGLTPNEAEAGTVFAQLPRAGKTVYPNSKVIMLVSTGPGEAALPKEPAEGGDSSE
jgi:beta-lactam-binding protein with PASTA domain